MQNNTTSDPDGCGGGRLVTKNYPKSKQIQRKTLKLYAKPHHQRSRWLWREAAGNRKLYKQQPKIMQKPSKFIEEIVCKTTSPAIQTVVAGGGW